MILELIDPGFGTIFKYLSSGTRS